MCIIVDANCANLTFRSPPHKDAVPVTDWIASGKGTLVYGGKITTELYKNESAKRWIIAATRAGRAMQLDTKVVKNEEDNLVANFNLASDDPHVLALARVSGARLLFTHDEDLIKDFTNHKIIKGPRGKIYKNKRQKNLLESRVCRT